MTRGTEQFDVIQMSLIDTWAATGAGAFTLSENGLYTTEAWAVVLSRLAPAASSACRGGSRRDTSPKPVGFSRWGPRR